NMVSKMFGAMMPRGSKKLALSKMNMGAKMIRSVMKKQNVDSLEDLIQQGVKLMACQIMGITQEELLDSVEFGGVASMLDDNDHSNMNLFI
ncbi:MAG TPA: pyridine nucleotide-disulfide oxidoreductase, partial [Erysipelotrichaceae bacterium]|nr:pyridine nucleotide-disulfide oxidoreductase [Erysipelotrichaceae bacterium]